MCKRRTNEVTLERMRTICDEGTVEASSRVSRIEHRMSFSDKGGRRGKWRQRRNIYNYLEEVQLILAKVSSPNASFSSH